MCSLVLSARLWYLVSFDNIARSTYMVFFLALARYCALFLSSLKARLYCLVFSNVMARPRCWFSLDIWLAYKTWASIFIDSLSYFGLLRRSGSLKVHGVHFFISSLITLGLLILVTRCYPLFSSVARLAFPLWITPTNWLAFTS